jgi:thioredoxin 1
VNRVCHPSYLLVNTTPAHAYNEHTVIVNPATAAMSVKEITSKAEFKALVSSTPFIALQAYVTWAGHCMVVAPIFENHVASLAIPGKYVFAKFDTDVAPDLAQELGISALPAFFFFENGLKTDELVDVNLKVLGSAVDKLSSKAKA